MYFVLVYFKNHQICASINCQIHTINILLILIDSIKYSLLKLENISPLPKGDNFIKDNVYVLIHRSGVTITLQMSIQTF